MIDYFTYIEPKYKECLHCCGTGMRGNYPCLKCDKFGKIEMTDDEIDEDNECRRDDAADLMNDN